MLVRAFLSLVQHEERRGLPGEQLYHDQHPCSRGYQSQSSYQGPLYTEVTAQTVRVGYSSLVMNEHGAVCGGTSRLDFPTRHRNWHRQSANVYSGILLSTLSISTSKRRHPQLDSVFRL